MLGKILCNGLNLFEYFHDFKIHVDDKEKMRPG